MPTDHPEPLQAIACPVCFGAVAAGPDLLGRAAECPLCGSGFRVPKASADDPPARLSAPAEDGASTPQRRRRKRGSETRSSSPPGWPEPAERRPTFPYDPPLATEPEQPAPSTELQFQEPVRTIVSGDRVVTLHRLSPKEKSVRRARRNVIMLLTGVSILMAIVLLLGRKRREHRSRQ